MANWKKMAEAFGRAFAQNKGTIKEDFNNAELSILRAFDRHSDDALGDVFRKGSRDGVEDRADAETRAEILQDEGVRGSLNRLTDDALDRMNDARTDRALEDEFNKEFNDAIERRKQGVKDRYGKDYPQDMAQEGADTFEKDLWNVIDELRAKGMSGNDILDILKGK